jgi:hypothetical protein
MLGALDLEQLNRIGRATHAWKGSIPADNAIDRLNGRLNVIQLKLYLGGFSLLTGKHSESLY